MPDEVKRTRRKLTPKDRIEAQQGVLARLVRKCEAARVKLDQMVKEAREAAQAQLDELPKAGGAS